MSATADEEALAQRINEKWGRRPRTKTKKTREPTNRTGAAAGLDQADDLSVTHLVGLGAADMDDAEAARGAVDVGLVELEVAHVEGDEFTPTECAKETGNEEADERNGASREQRAMGVPSPSDYAAEPP